MRVIYQSSWSCVVEREGNEIGITSVLNSTSYEARARIKVNVSSFKIEYARWDVYRGPDSDIVRNGEIPMLIGTDVMQYSARLAAQTLAPDLREILVELISECIRGAIQCEKFILMERGYLSYKQYFETKHDLLLDSCICFNQDRGEAPEMAHVGGNYPARMSNLFNRNKSYHICANPDGSLFATGCFTDSYHELLLTLSFSPGGQVQEISGSLLRSPEKVCCEGLKLLNNLIGENLAAMTKKEIAEFVGGTMGCTHVLEMCYDLACTLTKQAESNRNGLQLER